MGKETLKIYDDSKNYTCQVIKLPNKIPVKGLDNLVEVNYQGNSVLVGKDSSENDIYLFFPAESQLSHDFLHQNNLYRHETLNADPTQKGFFEDNRRVKAIKFKGIISSGFIIPVAGLVKALILNGQKQIDLKVGDEFNEIGGYEVCRKYVRKTNPGKQGEKNPKQGLMDQIIDKKQAPEHPDTGHLMRNLHKFTLDTPIVVSYKLHGTSARTYNVLVKKKLNWKAKLAKWFGVEVVTEDYDYVVCSRRQAKSVGFEELPNKNHFFTDGDLWSEWAKKNLEGKLNKGESIYYELVGKTYSGKEIQGGYTYGFDQPECFVYRIANINSQGIEVDLSYEQMKIRAAQLDLKVVPEFFKGTFGEFIDRYDNGQTYVEFEEPMTRIFYNRLLEKPSIFDPNVVEEGFCIRIDSSYPKAETFKIKSKKFLEYESKALDKDLANMEDDQTETNEGSSTEESNPAHN
jgi:hypothetical protein